jgi:membrane-bound inhibitor of C-type lysozyme
MARTLKTGVILAGLAALALAGCNTPSPEVEPEAMDPDMETTGVMATFQCPDGEMVDADFTTPQEVVVTLPDQEPITLPQVESASGARYSDGTTTLWNKGNEVMVEVDGETVLSNCVTQ